jgi:hypothetical protein
MQLSVKLKSTKEDLNFSVVIVNGELNILVDDEALKEKIISSKGLRIDSSNPVVLKPIDSIPPELVPLVYKDMFKLMISSEQELVNYSEGLRHIILKDLPELKVKEQKEWLNTHPDQGVCPSCVLGNVNRKILFKMLPYFYPKDRVDLFIDLLNILVNCINLGLINYPPEINIKTKEASDILSKYFSEIRNDKVCKSCSKFTIRRKYNNIIVAKLQEILKHPSHV